MEGQQDPIFVAMFLLLGTAGGALILQGDNVKGGEECTCSHIRNIDTYLILEDDKSVTGNQDQWISFTVYRYV